VVRREPARPEVVLGTVGCALIGLGEPGQALPVLFGLSSSVLVVVTALVMEAVVIAALGGALAGLGGRVRAVRWGVAVAALVAGVLMLWGLLAAGLERLLSTTVPAVPMLPMIIVVGAALVAGTVAAVVLETRSAPRGPAPVERNEPGGPPPTPPGGPSPARPPTAARTPPGARTPHGTSPPTVDLPPSSRAPSRPGPAPTCCTSCDVPRDDPLACLRPHTPALAAVLVIASLPLAAAVLLAPPRRRTVPAVQAGIGLLLGSIALVSAPGLQG